MANVTPEEIHSLAQLARLTFSADEAERLRGQFEQIVGYLDQLQSVDVRNVPEFLSQAQPDSALRVDETSATLSIDDALEPVPVSRDDQVEVPKFL